MTNTKFRKRALLSSVAMLLVALVALGSATFAWFTANPDANASGISLKTTAAAGLVVRTETDTTWSHSATLNKNGATFNLDPVSMTQTADFTFWNVIAQNSSQYGAKSGESMTQVTNVGRGASDKVFNEKIYCRLSDGSDTTANASKIVKITGVSITKNDNATMHGCIRVSIVQGTNLLGNFAITNAADPNGTKTTAAGTVQSNLTLTNVGTVDIPTGLTGLGNTSDSMSKYLDVYVWLDGQDGNCFSDKVGTENAAEIIQSIQIDLTLADPPAGG